MVVVRVAVGTVTAVKELAPAVVVFGVVVVTTKMERVGVVVVVVMVEVGKVPRALEMVVEVVVVVGVVLVVVAAGVAETVATKDRTAKVSTKTQSTGRQQRESPAG